MSTTFFCYQCQRQKDLSVKCLTSVSKRACCIDCDERRKVDASPKVLAKANGTVSVISAEARRTSRIKVMNRRIQEGTPRELRLPSA